MVVITAGILIAAADVTAGTTGIHNRCMRTAVPSTSRSIHALQPNDVTWRITGLPLRVSAQRHVVTLLLHCGETEAKALCGTDVSAQTACCGADVSLRSVVAKCWHKGQG